MTPNAPFPYDPDAGPGPGWDAPGGAVPLGGPAPAVRALVIGNTVAFLVELALLRFTSFDVLHWFGLSAHQGVGRLCVWQFITSMFLHSPRDIFHILFNMFALWIFGRDVEARYGTRKFLLFYFLCGVFAGICYVSVAALSGKSFVPAVGASGAIMGILVAFGCMFPDAIVLAFLMIPMRAKHMVLFLIGIDLVYFVFIMNTTRASSAHLGGVLFGYAFHRWGPRVEETLRRIETRERRRVRDDERRARQRVDDLLAKIGRGEALTRKERRFLSRASRRYFGRRGSG